MRHLAHPPSHGPCWRRLWRWLRLGIPFVGLLKLSSGGQFPVDSRRSTSAEEPAQHQVAKRPPREGEEEPGTRRKIWKRRPPLTHPSDAA